MTYGDGTIHCNGVGEGPSKTVYCVGEIECRNCFRCAACCDQADCVPPSYLTDHPDRVPKL